MNQFDSFFWGGFECADHINRSGDRINLLAETHHDKRVREDYHLLRRVGIRTVREGICWSQVERTPYVYNFSEVRVRIEAAEEVGIQQIWDLCHFGYPDDLIPTHPRFTERFVSLCRAFAAFYGQVSRQRLFVVPINEISFLSWHSGDVRGTVPFAVNSGFDIKYHLCKAAIKGIEALKETDPECKILLVEPMICIHPSLEGTYEDVWQVNEDQYQAMDIIMGRMCPELGGTPMHADILGFNYYYNCQWVHGGPQLPWPDLDLITSRRVPLSNLLKNGYERYGKPVVLSETGHFDELRARWIREISDECRKALAMGVDLRGICIYPVIERPDWDNLDDLHKAGLWDMDEFKNRIPHAESLLELRLSMEKFSSVIPEGRNTDVLTFWKDR
jgi:beta-glucosidase/6-phospho-beta-glucosidase/beta-galactosidase